MPFPFPRAAGQFRTPTHRPSIGGGVAKLKSVDAVFGIKVAGAVGTTGRDASHFALTRRQVIRGAAALAGLALAPGVSTARSPAAPDPFIEKLIRRMTLEEKAGQLSIQAGAGIGRAVNPQGGEDPTLHNTQAEVRAGRVVGYFNCFDVGLALGLQKIAVEQSRLGIPLIFAADVIHGLRTAYPIPLGESASFDAELCYRTARAAAVEATAYGLHWTFAPMVDVARDQRWGRVMEGAGEDPWLGSLIAAARVRGFQGPDLRADDALLACPKHFAGYGAVQGGMEYNTADIPETTLRQVHLPPFKAAFDAGALSVMSAFNDIAGVPATGNRHLLTDILREEWQYRGLVVSDYEAEKELIAHGYAADEQDAVIKALWAGCDIAMQSGLYARHIPQLVRTSRLPEARVDEAVRRVLRVKKALGLFDKPYRSLDPQRPAQVEARPEARALALEAACKSIVLLKNEGGALPLPRSGASIAFIGPYVSDRSHALGGWMLYPDMSKVVTLEQGLRNVLGADAPFSLSTGCAAEQPIEGGFEAAVAAARNADVVVLYLGEPTGRTAEAASTVSITLPPVQQALAEAVAAVGKPLVVLLKHGRALALTGAVRNAQAIVCTWYLGSESGNAIAQVLFGDFAPQGRLPVSFPQAAGQQPYFYNHRPTGRPQQDETTAFKARYLEASNQALYPFGHGLGYSVIVYGKTQVDSNELTRRGSITVSATVTNAGPRRQHEVAQLYIRDRVASITQPVRVLKGIQHLDIESHAVVSVSFQLRAEDLRYVHPDLSDTADAGVFEVWIAASSDAGEPAVFSLV